MKKHVLTAVLATVAFSPLAAHAQATPTPAAAAQGTPAAEAGAKAAVSPTVGAKVFDSNGGEVGTVEKVDAANAVVNTGAKRATLPLAAFGKNEKGLLISMDKASLEAAVAQAEAKTATATSSALVADAQVKSSDGVVVGTVQKVEGDNVTLALTDGGPVTVTKQYLTTGADGTLALTMKAAELKSAVAAATQSAATAPASADAKAGASAQTAETQPSGE